MKLSLNQEVSKRSRAGIFFAGILLGLGFLIYSNTFHASFHLDDQYNITENTDIRHGPGLVKLLHNPRAIALLTFALNYHFSKGNVLGYHLFNLLIHILSSWLVFKLVGLIFRILPVNDSVPERDRNLTAFFSALIFLCHPLQTQAVTYIVQRMASLAACFYLAAVCAYLKARWDRSRVFYILALVAALLAAFTKETSYTLPFTLLLFELSLFRNTQESVFKKMKRLLPFFSLLPIAYFVMYHRAVMTGNMELISRGDTWMPRSQYLLTQFRVILTYLRLLFFPVGQNLDYDYPLARSFFEFKTAASFFFLSSLLATAVALFKRQRILSLGILWFFLTLSIESSIFPINDVIFEHRLYLPMFGFAMCFSFGAYRLFKNRGRYVVCLSLVVLVLSVLTFSRNRVWKDELVLWQDVVKKSPHKSRGYDGLGVALSEAGRLEEAKENLLKSLRNIPPALKARADRGFLLAEQGRYPEARAQFEEVPNIKPPYYETYNTLGVVSGRLGNYEEAVGYLRRSLLIDPDYENALNNLGIALRKLGRLEEAAAQLKKAVAIREDYAEAHFNLGNVLKDQGHFEEARTCYLQAARFKPDRGEAYNGIGVTYYSEGKNGDAISYFEKAIRSDPDYAEAYSNMGLALAQRGDLENAEVFFSEALRLRPDFQEARQGLDAVRDAQAERR